MHLAAGAAALPAASGIARAQVYPARPVRIIVPYPPGGPTDIIARLVAQWLSKSLGQQFFIENRPGADGNIGTEAVVHAPANGYTLLLAGSNNTVNATLYNNLKFDFIRDIAPVASIVSVPLVMLVHPSLPAHSVSEFIAYVKANPGKVNYASGGIGSAPHLAAEMFKIMAGVNLVHVPYRGAAPALTDLLAGQVQVSFISMLGVIDYIKAGSLRPLAVTTSKRSEVLPELPTVAEFVPRYDTSFWTGIGAPRNTPPEIIQKLNREINAALASPVLKAQLADQGGAVLGGSPAEFGKFIADNTEQWGKVIRALNIKPE